LFKPDALLLPGELILSEGLAQFHPELNAVVKANDIIAAFYDSRSDSYQRAYFINAILS